MAFFLPVSSSFASYASLPLLSKCLLTLLCWCLWRDGLPPWFSLSSTIFMSLYQHGWFQRKLGCCPPCSRTHPFWTPALRRLQRCCVCRPLWLRALCVPGPEDGARRLPVPVPWPWHRLGRGMRCILFVFIWIKTNVRFPWLRAACMLDDQLFWARGCGVISSASRSLSLHAGLGP